MVCPNIFFSSLFRMMIKYYSGGVTHTIDKAIKCVNNEYFFGELNDRQKKF